jgi:hypothetical protein
VPNCDQSERGRKVLVAWGDGDVAGFDGGQGVVVDEETDGSVGRCGEATCQVS